MNYGELKTLIADYLHRTDLTTQIVTFIKLAQARMSHDLDLVEMEAAGTVATVASQEYASVPSGMIKLLSIKAPSNGGYVILEQDTLMGVSVRNSGGATGIPEYYARHADRFYFSPIPSEILSLPVLYLSRFTNFTADADTDDLLTNHPNVYVYATMLEALPFLVDAKNTWKDLYAMEVATLNNLAQETRWSGGPLVMGTRWGVTIR